MSKKFKSSVITKTPQEFIHVKHVISFFQYKCWLLLIKSYEEFLRNGTKPDSKGFYHLSISVLNNAFGYELSSKMLRQEMKELTHTGITFNFLEKNGESCDYFTSFILECFVSSKKIRFRLPSFIDDVLTGDESLKKMFLVLDWDTFQTIKGKYEAIIYKLCKDYLGVGRTPYFSIEKYKEYVGLEEQSYPVIGELIRITVKKPLSNLAKNEKIDIDIELVLKRGGRGGKILGFHFVMKKRKQETPKKLPTHPVFDKAKADIKHEKQLEILEKYSPAEIEVIFDEANLYIEKEFDKSKLVNPGAVYNKAFAEGWGLAALAAKKQYEQEKIAKKQEKQRKKAEAEQKEQLEQEEMDANQKMFEMFFEALNPEKKEELLNDVEQQLTIDFMRKQFAVDRQAGVAHKNPMFTFMLKTAMGMAL